MRTSLLPVADAEQVVDWVMDNYSSMEDGFAEAEIDLRSSDAPVNKILDDLAKLVSDRRIHSVEKKNELIVLKEKLEGKKLEIEKEMMEADSSMRDSYGLALSEIEGKLDDKIKPLLDFDFQYLDKFERDLNASMLDWKRYLKISDGVLDEELIRNELANRVSEHFHENMAKPIEERKKNGATQGFLGIVWTIMKNQPSQYPNAEEGLNLNEARGWQRMVMQMHNFSLAIHTMSAEQIRQGLPSIIQVVPQSR